MTVDDESVSARPKVWVINSQFSWVRILGVTLLGPPFYGLCWGCRGLTVSARVGVSSETSTGKGPKHMWLLAEFSFLWPIGLRRSLPWCLLVGGCPQFLATWASLIWPLALSKRANQEDKRKVAISCNVMTEMTSHQFCHLLLLRSSHRPRSQLRGTGMDYTGRDISTRRIGNWGPL